MTRSDPRSFCKTYESGVPAPARCFDGHFPGNPIVPGAILLSYASELLAVRGQAISGISRMKFAHPLRPGQPFDIEVAEGATTKIRWLANGLEIARARVTLCALDE